MTMVRVVMVLFTLSAITLWEFAVPLQIAIYFHFVPVVREDFSVLALEVVHVAVDFPNLSRWDSGFVNHSINIFRNDKVILKPREVHNALQEIVSSMRLCVSEELNTVTHKPPVQLRISRKVT